MMDELQQGTARHAHPLALIGLLHIAAYRTDGRLAIRMDMQLEGERKHCQYTGNGLQFSRINTSGACDVGTDELCPSDMNRLYQLLIRWDASIAAFQPVVMDGHCP